LRQILTKGHRRPRIRHHLRRVRRKAGPAAVSEACKTFGRIDILVNNAAFFNKKGGSPCRSPQWEKQIGVIFTGAFLFTKACRPSR